jgi:two-component system OmpR family sensor kinase
MPPLPGDAETAMGRLFWKFFLSILLAQVAATVGIGGNLWLREQALQRAGTAALDSSPPAELLLDAASVAFRHGGVPALCDMIGVMRLHTVIVLDEHGRDLMGRPPPAELREQARRALADPHRQRTIRTLVTPEGQRLLVFVPRVYLAGPNPSARGEPPRIVPAGPPPLFDHQIRPFLPIAAATLASLLFAALLAWYFSRRIHALRSAFQAASKGALAPRFADSPSGDELSELGHEFDRMSAQLRALIEGQRRLLHDVSHELRSPLARLQAAIGLAHQQPERTPALLQRIERESVRMDKLVGELLTLSRLEGPNALAMTEAVDVGEMIGQIAADVRFEAGESGPRVSISATQGGMVRGAPDMLWRALENVVRNAACHGSAGGMIDIVLGAAAQSLTIEVLDRGPGIDPAHLSAVFQPFFRSHSNTGSVSGYGLGLVIARRINEAHGGTIAVSNRSGGGLREDNAAACCWRRPIRRWSPIARRRPSMVPRRYSCSMSILPFLLAPK